MTTIGLISDVHADPGPVEEALALFADQHVSEVFCLGDIAGYNESLTETISLLKKHSVQSIYGNHDLKYLKKQEVDSEQAAYLKQLPAFISKKIDGKQLYFVHAQPPDICHGGIKLLNKQGEIQQNMLAEWEKKIAPYNYDVLVVGHTHQVFVERMGSTLVINPGSTVFNHCCAILSLPDLNVELFSLSGNNIVNTWNWSDHVIYKK